MSVEVVVFDVNETLSDMSPLAEAFAQAGLGPDEVEPWFAGLLRDGFALTTVGENPRFADLAADSLHTRLHRHGVAEAEVDAAVATVMGAFGTLGVHPDVADGIEALRERGLRLVTLSNGSATVAQGLLDRAGLSDAFERLLSVEEAGVWKPHPDSYRYAVESCGVPATSAMLVAVHPWDIDGAARAGLRTGWLNRQDGRYPPFFTPPEVQAATLGELAVRLS